MLPLEGLRILDFSRFLPGAYASWVAADLGADVIRVEHPRELAKQQQMFGKGVDEEAEARRRARPTYTRNKRSMLINPGHERARPILEALIERADILIEDYRPGVLAGMGYGYDAMAALNPRLIYLSVSFTGQTGPLAGRAGHDPAALALAGALSRLNGLPTPSLPGLQVADVLAGCHATIAMFAALQARERTSRGQHVDVAMSDACMPLLMVTMGRHDDLDAIGATPDGSWHPKGGVWECADGLHICTTDMEPAYWSRFCEAVDRPDFIPLRTQPERYPEMRTELERIFRTRSRDEWFDLLGTAGTQAIPVLSIAEAVEHPHNLARDMVVELPVPGSSEPVRQLGLPFHLSDTSPPPSRVAGPPGADTAAILAEIGIDDETRRELEEAGIFSSESRS